MALTGTKFYDIKSNMGRDKLFASAELLWEAACEYFTWIDDNPNLKAEVSAYKGEVILTEVPVKRPYQMGMLLKYIGASENYFCNFKYESKKITGDEERVKIVAVIEECEKIIRAQKFDGASSGFFNANFIARDLGLTDKKELSGEIKVDDAVDLRQLNDEELEQYYALAKKSIKKD